MISRRQFTQLICGLASTGLLSYYPSAKALTRQQYLANSTYYMPDEGEKHLRTWMAFVADEAIWSPQQIPEVQRNLITIAVTIARYEPVFILVRSQDYQLAQKLLSHSTEQTYPIHLIPCPLNDLWVRDTGPTFVSNNKHQKVAIDFNFNGWGEDQEYDLDRHVARFVAETAQVPHIRSSLVLEGGCFEVDGHGTAIMTESCIINDNRNPNISKKEIEKELKALLGLEKIIWLKGIKGKDITDGHTDFYARFIRPGIVAVSRETNPDIDDYKVTRDNINTLRNSTDAQNRTLELVVLDTPQEINPYYDNNDFAAGYIGYYICNNAIIMQKFGDKKADTKAKNTLQQAFPNHTIEQIAVDGIASGGGSIHCATQQEPTSR